MAAPPKRSPFIDEAKALAILWIAFYHLELALVLPSRSMGVIGVDIFLLLSGWSLARSKSNPTFGAYFSQRALRILPAYWIALFILGVLKPIATHQQLAWAQLATHASTLHAFFGHPHIFAINPSFWFISLLPLTYGIAFGLRKLSSALLITAIGLALALASHLVFTAYQLPTLSENYSPRILSFCLGFAAAKFSSQDTPFRFSWLCLLPLGLTIFIVQHGSGFLFTLPILGSLALLAYGYLRDWGRSPKFPTLSIALVFLGTLSYEFFLIHQPLLRIGIAFGLPESLTGRALSAALGLLLAIPLAMLLHWFVNKLVRAVSLKKPVPLPRN